MDAPAQDSTVSSSTFPQHEGYTPPNIDLPIQDDAVSTTIISDLEALLTSLLGYD